jgi:hypothetical protein
VARALRLRADERADYARELPVAEDGHAVRVLVGPFGVATVKVTLAR